MASINRYRGGQIRKVAFPTGYAVGDSTAVSAIEIGDLVYKHSTSGVVRSAANFPNMGSVATTQEAFASAFVGVAGRKTGLQPNEVVWQLQQSIDPGWTLVQTSGIYEMDCAAGTTWQPGDLVGVYATATGGCGTTAFGTSKSQQVMPVTGGQETVSAASYSQAIGIAIVPFNLINTGFAAGLNPPYSPSPSIPAAPGIVATPSTCSTVLVEIRSAIMGDGLLPAAGDWVTLSADSGSGQ